MTIIKWIAEAFFLLLGAGLFLFLLFVLTVFAIAAAKKIKEVWKDDGTE